ncbi:MAG: hypothetical protein N4A54_08750 [Peptostreptococcaceae bacterium]|jgi:dsDNA-specific endonuclease/ATPase MutS2|nr:hypothetical protein [Peptostreptococcaceae bacterium]
MHNKLDLDGIGISYILNNLQLQTPFSKDLKKNLKFFDDKEKLKEEFLNIEKMIRAYKNKDLVEIKRYLRKLKDIKNSLLRCKNNMILDEVELFEIKSFAMSFEDLRRSYFVLNLDIKNIKLNSLSDLIKILDPEDKKMPSFFIYEAYSKKLKIIRDNKKDIEKDILKEDSQEKREILMEKRLEIVLEEEKEEYEIRKNISNQIIKFVDLFLLNIKSISYLDFLIAKAELAVKYNAIKPKVIDSMSIKIKNAFNPEVKDILKKSNKEFTKISIELKRGVSLITGANMGGKSISLKTIALNYYMAISGFFSFCDEIEICLLDFLSFVSDDMQSISRGLSTFGAEIMNLKSIIEQIKTKRGLIIMDEFARGTNPKEGRNLLKGLLNYLKDKDTISLLTTHYDNVYENWMNHYQVVGLKNVDFKDLKELIKFDKKYSVEIIQKHMDYRLLKMDEGKNVPKDAFNICKLLGLEDEILNGALKYYKEGEINEEQGEFKLGSC